jgi:hypothetical protein
MKINLLAKFLVSIQNKNKPYRNNIEKKFEENLTNMRSYPVNRYLGAMLKASLQKDLMT